MKDIKMMYFVILILSPYILFIVAEPIAVESTTEASGLDSPCDTRCGCDKELVYDSIQEKCVVNIQNVTERVIKYNENQGSIYREADKVFKGMMISVLIFILCAGICVFAACIYCCRINYTDRQLNNDVKALAKKLKRDYKSKPGVSKTPLQPISENCNVVVAQSGLYVV